MLGEQTYDCAVEVYSAGEESHARVNPTGKNLNGKKKENNRGRLLAMGLQWTGELPYAKGKGDKVEVCTGRRQEEANEHGFGIGIPLFPKLSKKFQICKNYKNKRPRCR